MVVKLVSIVMSIDGVDMNHGQQKDWVYLVRPDGFSGLLVLHDRLSNRNLQ